MLTINLEDGREAHYKANDLIFYNTRMETENTSSCRDKNKKTLKEIEDAQLAAHRYKIYSSLL